MICTQAAFILLGNQTYLSTIVATIASCLEVFV